MSSRTVSSQPLTLHRERNAILALLLVLASLAWLYLVLGRPEGDGTATGLTMGIPAPLFMAMWAMMMVAMMFPASAPMILMFSNVHRARAERGQAFAPTWVFVSGYILVWLVAGAVAYGAAIVAEASASQVPWLTANAARIGGFVLISAGLYQLSPLKRSCVTKCQTPFQVIMTSWRDGYGGAFRMGFDHGRYCLGCCVFLFAILFPLGVMNIGAMIAITAFIFAEKSLPVARQLGLAAAAVLVIYGAAVMLQPDLLPTAMDSMSDADMMQAG